MQNKIKMTSTKKIALSTLIFFLIVSVTSKIYADDSDDRFENNVRVGTSTSVGLQSNTNRNLSEGRELEDDEEGGPVRIGNGKLPTITPFPTTAPVIPSTSTGTASDVSESTNNTTSTDITPTPAPTTVTSVTPTPTQNGSNYDLIKKLIDDFKSFLSIFFK